MTMVMVMAMVRLTYQCNSWLVVVVVMVVMML